MTPATLTEINTNTSNSARLSEMPPPGPSQITPHNPVHVLGTIPTPPAMDPNNHPLQASHVPETQKVTNSQSATQIP